MKEQLKVLYKTNHKEYLVWSYLWVFSDKNKVSFSYTKLSSKFGIPISTLHRVINKNIAKWSEQGLDISISKVEFKTNIISFKSVKETSKNSLNDNLYRFLKHYYNSIDFDYADIDKHKRYIQTILNKLKKAMIEKGSVVDENSLEETFKVFITNIDGWWKDSGNITLPLISKHFTKILNQVKHNANGTKRDNYSIAANKADEINFDKLTRK